MRVLSLAFVFVFSLSVFGQQKMSERALDGFNGKVKSVTTSGEIIESKNFFDNTLKKLRDRIELYDENGAPTETVDYQSNYKYIYAFVDGYLTSKSFQIEKRDTVRTVAGMTSADSNKENKPRDSRYDIKYENKFDEKGRVIEKTLYGNNGEIYNRNVYKYDEKNSIVEELRYNDGTKLN